MKSISKSCKCPKCNCVTDTYHGTYNRKVQDLPILGKNVQLEICSHEYACMNANCETTTFAETFHGFLNAYSRMTERCADFICTLALETSCEGCARICRKLGIKTSGDTLREWLKNNKNIKVVTRDRAGAYAKVISEELPDAMQIADRFHLHQNLLEAIKKALNHEIPAVISIPHVEQFPAVEQSCKKNRI